jgi:arylsulfatase A-like enzyme
VGPYRLYRFRWATARGGGLGSLADDLLSLDPTSRLAGGEFNEWRFFNGLPSDPAVTLEHLDDLGTPRAYNHYNTGWAWALDTPFPYWKRWAGAEGGVADMCLVSWPAQLAADPSPRQQYTTPSM